MKLIAHASVISLASLIAFSAHAQAPPPPPANTTFVGIVTALGAIAKLIFSPLIIRLNSTVTRAGASGALLKSRSSVEKQVPLRLPMFRNASILREVGKAQNIHLSSGVIWGIPAKLSCHVLERQLVQAGQFASILVKNHRFKDGFGMAALSIVTDVVLETTHGLRQKSR